MVLYLIKFIKKHSRKVSDECGIADILFYLRNG